MVGSPFRINTFLRLHSLGLNPVEQDPVKGCKVENRTREGGGRYSFPWRKEGSRVGKGYVTYPLPPLSRYGSGSCLYTWFVWRKFGTYA